MIPAGRIEKRLPLRLRRRLHEGHLGERNAEKLSSRRDNRHIDKHEAHVTEATDLVIDSPFRGMMDCHACGFIGPYDRQRFQKRERKTLNRARRGTGPKNAAHKFTINAAATSMGDAQ